MPTSYGEDVWVDRASLTALSLQPPFLKGSYIMSASVGATTNLLREPHINSPMPGAMLAYEVVYPHYRPQILHQSLELQVRAPPIRGADGYKNLLLRKKEEAPNRPLC